MLGQIERLTLSRKSSLNCRLVLISASPLKLPFHPPFEILHLTSVLRAAGDMATVTWSNQMERLKGMGCGVNFKADA